MGFLEQEKEAVKLSQFEKGRQRGELHEKVLQLEKDLMQMRCTLERGSNDQPIETLPMSREDFDRQMRQEVDTELFKLREALRDAEMRAKTQQEEQNQALQKLQTSTVTQRVLLNQIEEMNQRRQNHSEMQEQLSEANNKISRAFLDKAILSTQVLKMEDNIKELKANLTGSLSEKNHLIKEKAALHQRAQVLESQLQTAQQRSECCDIEPHNNKQDQETVVMKGGKKALREANEKLTCELEKIKQELKTSQSQLQEATAERVTSSKQIKAVEAERSQLIREKEELLSKMNEEDHDELRNIKEKCSKFREYVKVLELEKHKLQDWCQCLEAEVFEKSEKLHQQEEEHQKQDAVRVQSIEELKAAASHWAEKWQKVALTLQSTQEELEELKRNNSRNEKESDLLLKFELDACKRELERSRSPALIHRYKDKGGEASVQTEDTETQTVLSQSSLLWEPPSDSHRSQNKAPGAFEDDQNAGSHANVSTTDSLRAQLEESRRRTNQLQRKEAQAVQRLQTLGLYSVKDEKPPVEGRKDKMNVDTDQQRKMVTEQLKSLFKGQEGKEAHNRSAAGQTEASSAQDWSQTSKVVRNPVDRRIWQQSSGLMPVFEEDEEGSDWPTGEEGKEEEEAHAEENLPNQSLQMSSLSAEIYNLKAKNENLLEATLTCKQSIQDRRPPAKKRSDTSRHCSDDIDLQQKISLSFYPDGVFLAELVDISSPDEDEEEGKGK
ncbi:myosin-11-like [Cyclopterus lumpus]|uniref:myosin-11-like n=1 Tax=Cyclopterus lumpus TaxID=8103 RepID=UPI0014867073|nr:myosin-11-like [Cyclopterus lumpus]